GSEVRLNGHSAEEVMEVPVGPGEEIVLVKYSVFADSIRAKDCLESAVAEMDKALGVPLDVHYEHQRSYLENYWDNCMLEIDGDEELNIAVRYNMYQLLQSAGKDEYCNIAAKGLSGEGYEGHYFWDTEMYIEPFFNLTNPEITRSLISFRYRTLDKARENARLLGHKKGALYPWRTIAGSECSGYFPSGTAGYHINGDIASSIIFYYLATGDFELIAEMGAEIVFETARLWIDMGCYSDGRFMINEVTGPDEYTCLVNNNYYTNVSAQFNLKWASRLYHMLKASGRLGDIVDKIGITEEEIKEFERAADHMYLPYDEKLKINPQDDSFLQKKVWDLSGTPKDHFPLLLHYHPLTLYRHQVCKQADTVLAHFLFEDAQDMETIRNSYYYYEKITTHDSSLSTAIFSIMASKLGDVDRA
ncbi:MAG TPA: family 65 glycosyl hydrolase, partial [Candidatus Atribacteria bacterium]|nr:family 65 glycosyl hydrolase [Candidatus Atribacteria bacterium]